MTAAAIRLLLLVDIAAATAFSDIPEDEDRALKSSYNCLRVSLRLRLRCPWRLSAHGEVRDGGMSSNGKRPSLRKLPLPSSAPDLPVLKPSEQEFEDLAGLLCSHDTLLRCCASQTADGDHGLYELHLEEAGSMYMSDFEGIIAESESEADAAWSSDVKTAEIEFWRNIGLGDSSTVYTAQSLNSTLFDKSTRLWNLHAMHQQVFPVACLLVHRIQQEDTSTARGPPHVLARLVWHICVCTRTARARGRCH
jgi:hypothetical protein